MLHVDDVKVRKIKTTRIEVAIESDGPIDAKGWNWLYRQATIKLAELMEGNLQAHKRSADDAFFVRIEEGAVVFYFEVEKVVS